MRGESTGLLIDPSTVRHAQELERFKGQLVTIHQLDCIYYGQINRSYNKEGFGILQTIQFETYFGFWKNGKAEGLGAVIYPNGQILYGNFMRNDLCGAAIIDDGQIMRVGVFQGIQNVGVGYEYHYDQAIWKMVRYIKGVPIEQIKQQQMHIDEGIPTMIAAQHSIYQLLKNYKENNWFEVEEKRQRKNEKEKDKKKEEAPSKYLNLSKFLLSQDENHVLMIGCRDEGGLHGLGCFYSKNEKKLLEAGFYRASILQGYAYQSATPEQRMIGPFSQGLKHGTFIEVSLGKTLGKDYVEDVFVSNVVFTEQQLRKRQKAYNYQQKDFLSAKNSLELVRIYEIFLAPQVRIFANKTKAQPHYLAKSQAPARQADPSPPARTTTSQLLKPGRKTQLLDKRISHTYLNQGTQGNGQRSSIAIMRQKMHNYQLIKTESQARSTSANRRKNVLASTLRMFEDEEQAIALEENPFDSVMLGMRNTIQVYSQFMNLHSEEGAD